MGGKAQTVVELHAGSYGEPDLSVSRLVGREGLSEPFAFDVEFHSSTNEPLDLAALGGADALVTLRRPDGTERFVHGVVWTVELTHVQQSAPRYRLRVAPKLSRLGLVRRSRVFQARSVPEIVKQVLGDAGVTLRDALQGSYAAREYCLQYRESDLAFVSRLLEEEGIFYWFEHARDAHTLVLADAAAGCAELAGDPVVPFRVPHPGDAPEEEHVSRVAHALRARAGKVVLRDFDFERPELQVVAQREASGAPLGLEHYAYPGGFRAPSAGTPIARIRLEEQRLACDTFSAEGTCVRFHPGATFELSGYPDPAFDRKLLLVGVAHEAAQQTALGRAGGVEHGYRNAAFAIDAALPYRPRRRTQRPRAYAETATVVGPPGEEIHVDAHGRVKIQFHWDRHGAKDEAASCFVRLAQAWAGAAWGASFVPRIGQEVVVRFLDGNPDAPLVVGAVYNAAAPTPVQLPDDKTKSTVRTDSSVGGGGSNELRFEDAKGAEEVYVHAQKDERVVVEHDKRQSVFHAEALDVGKDRTQTVNGKQTLAVGQVDATAVTGNRSLTVTGNRTTAVAQSHVEKVLGSQTVTVGRTQTVEIGGGSSTLVGAAAALTVGGAYAVNVGAALNVGVVGARLEQVGGVRAIAVGGAEDLRVAKDASSRCGGDDAITVASLRQVHAKDREETVGQKAQLLVADKVVVLAKELKLTGKQRFTLNVGGKQILQAKGGKVLLAGKTITLEGSGAGTLKGSKVSKTAGAGPASASAKKVKKDEAKPPSIKSASFSKPTIEPVHPDASGATPASCEAAADIAVTNVPDGTKAQVAVHHCASGALVKGTKVECKVQGGKLVDAKTGKPPVIKLDAAKLPWDPWDKPFFYLVASVKHGGLKVETPRDMKDGGKSLRVKYWSVAVADAWADQGGLTTADEAREITGILKSVPNSLAEPRIVRDRSPSLAKWGKHLANTYAFHQGSHGGVSDRSDPDVFIDHGPPPDGLGNPPECPIGNWRSVALLSYPMPDGTTAYLQLGDREIRDERLFPSTPRYLAYFDCCLAGWEPSLGRALAARGTRYVIAFRKVIDDTPARNMARSFYEKWAKTHKLDPDRIRSVFFEVGADYYGDMRPVLIGWKYEPILDPASGALEQATEKVKQILGGVVNAIGSLFK